MNRNEQYERMLGVLSASFPDIETVAEFLVETEAKSPDKKKRDLARELMRYVFDRCYLVKPM